MIAGAAPRRRAVFSGPRKSRRGSLRAAPPGCDGAGAGLRSLHALSEYTRSGPAPATRSFDEVLLAGLAEDGGLFVPERLPALDREAVLDLAGLPYAELAARIVGLFAAGSFAAAELRARARAYGTFGHAAVAPLVQLDERLWLLELFHGPTLAFKDLALQLVGLMFDSVLARRGEHVTIVGATSGDTGSAAMAACRDRAALDIFMLYPHGRISEVQRRQMTTSTRRMRMRWRSRAPLTTARTSSKRCSPTRRLRRDLNLSAVNSINFARVAAQIVYYIAAGLALGAPSRAVSFSVPTGNFGNVYAGHLARALGLPIERLVIGTNANDILARYLSTGEMTDRPGPAEPQPEHGHPGRQQFRAAAVRAERPQRQRGRRRSAAVPRHRRLAADDQAWRAARALFSGHRVDDAMTLDEIAETYRRSGLLIDPHTAVAVAAARRESGRAGGTRPRSSRSPPRTRRNSPMRSSAPPASARRCRRLSRKSRKSANGSPYCRMMSPRWRASCAPTPGGPDPNSGAA